MADRNIDIPTTFKYSFQVFKKYASFIIGVTITYLVLGLIPQLYLYLYSTKDPSFGRQMVDVIASLVQVFLALGFTKIMMYLIDDRPVHVLDLINNGSNFLSYFVANFLYQLAVVIGLVLFIVPGVYLAVRLQFYPYFIVEYGDSSFEALRKSWYATEDNFWEFFVFGACVLLLNIIGVALVGIGFIFAYPLTTLASAVVFKGLIEGASAIPTPPYQP